MIRIIISFIIFFLIFFFIFAMFSADDNYRECERYEAANIPRDMNPCWGSIKK